MKKIDISKIKTYSKFITKGLKSARLISYEPNANEKNRLIFMVESNIIHTDETGTCYSINGFDQEYSGGSFGNFDVYVDDVINGWINIYDSETTDESITSCSPIIYNSYENARKNANEFVINTIKIEWVIE